MRRKVTLITVLCMLVGATAAYAALNTNAGTTQTFSKGVGSKSKPVPIGFKQTLVATNTDSTKAAAPLIDIKTKIYGLVSNANSFPTCSATQMSARKSDSFCPAKSKFATGLVNSLLGDSTLLLGNTPPHGRTACNPNLDVFNAGKGKLWFFFTTHSAIQCGGLTTGATAPYPGFQSQQGKYLVTDVPLPPDVSTKVANVPNFYGSLIRETLNWAKVTTKVKGKTIGNQSSVACLKGKRPWEIDFTATDGKTTETNVVKGSSPC